jgi:hypothetical protein
MVACTRARVAIRRCFRAPSANIAQQYEAEIAGVLEPFDAERSIQGKLNLVRVQSELQLI